MSKSPSLTPAKVSPTCVEESNEFLELFAHRYDYLWAEHPLPGDRPDWRTENRHPLSDRLILQGSYLYGVRFGSTTSYLMLDIDKGSAHHPSRDPLAIGRIVDALEAIGLTGCVAVQSSYSGGIHLYFPWGGVATAGCWAELAAAMDSESEPVPFSVQSSEPLPSWAVAQAAESVLLSAGIKPAKGQLEIFPNPKKAGDASLFNGHRLPLQAGGYLLNADWEPVFSSREEFVRRWRFASSRNWISRPLVDAAIASAPRPWKKIGKSAQKFLNDLNAEIQNGWTGHGQTNSIVGKLVLREYVFGQMFVGYKLRGFELASRVLSLVWQLPGFKEHCRHLLEIAKRIDEWVRCVESNPRYYPYGGKEVLQTDAEIKPLSESEKRALEAQNRIKEAVAFLIREKKLPALVSDRINAIRARLKESTGQAISPATLYKYQRLWHPHHLSESPKASTDMALQVVVEPQDDARSLEARQEEGLQVEGTISFYASFPDPSGGGASSDVAAGGSGGLSTGLENPQGLEFFKQKLAEIRASAAQRKLKFWQQQPESPPDESWFAQQQLLPLEVVSDAS